MLQEFPIFLVIFIIMLKVLIIRIVLYIYDSFIYEGIMLKSSKFVAAPSPNIQ